MGPIAVRDTVQTCVQHTRVVCTAQFDKLHFIIRIV